jgi:hypothetical protein
MLNHSLRRVRLDLADLRESHEIVTAGIVQQVYHVCDSRRTISDIFRLAIIAG